MSSVTLVEAIEQVLVEFSALTLLKALVVGIIGVLLYKKGMRALKEVLKKQGGSDRVKVLILKSVKIICLAALFLLVAAELGFETSSLMILFAVVILVCLNAGEDILGNTACGLVMASADMFHKGDFVSVNGKEGTVREIRMNYTKLESLTGEIFTIPNKSISTTTVTNYSSAGIRCVLLKLMASYESDPEKVTEVCQKMISSTEGVLLSRPPRVFVSEYGENNIKYDVYFWVNASDFLLKKYEVTGKVYRTFKEAGIQISCPRVRLEGTENSPEGSGTEQE